MCLMFFFFKQKTAYEMRISDWSSDVCSSDLEQRPPCAAIECVVRLRRLPVAGFLVSVRCAQRRPLIVRSDCAASEADHCGQRERAPVTEREIGRASGRERVCQYV